MRIDMHTHIVPRAWPDWSERHGPGRWPRLVKRDDKTMMMMGDAPFMPLDDRFWSAERRIEDMDRIGLDMQILSPIPMMACYWTEAKANQEFARLLNDDIAATVASHPKRFLGMATVPLQDIDLSIAELRYVRETLGFRSVQIGSCPAGRELDDPQLFPFLAACRDLDVGVFVHPIEPVVGRDRLGAYYLPNIVGNVLESALAISRLVCGGVLERLPGLRMCFAHAGGAFPFVVGRLDKGYAVRPETKANISRAPSDFARDLFIDSLSFDPASLRFAMAKHGEDKVMLGSDYPFSLGDGDPVASLREAALGEALEERITDRNIQAFLGL